MVKIRSYQSDSLRQIAAFDGRALLADEMGLGKTLTAYAYAVKFKKWPLCVVCPFGLKEHWRREAWEHFRIGATVLSGRVPYISKALSLSRLFVINYDILQGWLAFFKRRKLQLVIGDEIHMIGNMGTLRSRCFKELCRGVPHVLGLSGTPFTNKPWDLYPILSIIDPKRFSSPFAYGTKYCDASRDYGQWNFTGARNLGSLNRKLKLSCLVRHTKQEVASQLPPKTRYVVPLEIENSQEYERAERDVISWLAETDIAKAQRAARAERYTRFSYLKALAAKLKMKAVLSWIDTYLSSGNKLFVGILTYEVSAVLMKKYGKRAVLIDGTKSAKEREQAEKSFRTDPTVPMCVANIKAGGVGLNLPEARGIAFVQFPWTATDIMQFEARPHRMNSVNPVDVYFLAGVGTIEEKLFEIIQCKMKILDKVLDGVPVQESSLTIWDELQRLLQEKRK